jgi:DNA-binding NtrC family response regulator/ligand-binding sensor domain-containing protein
VTGHGLPPGSRTPPGRLGTWRTFTPADGLASLRIEQMALDARGCLWFTSLSNGVSRYDGDEFVTFTTRDGLATDAVTCAVADPAGRVWLGGYGGLCYSDGDRFHSVETPWGSDYWVRTLFVDNDGRLWIAATSDHAELPCLVGRVEGDTFHDLTREFARDCAGVRSHCWGICQDDEGHLWLAMGRLVRHDGNAFRVFGPEHGLPDKPIHCLTRHPHGGPLWLGGMGTLGCFDGHAYTPADVSFDSDVRRILHDRHGRVWVCTYRHGVFCFGQGGCQIYLQEDGLPEPFVTTVQVDTEDLIWFASWGTGVRCYDPLAVEKVGTGLGLPAAAVAAIAADREGRIWAGFGSIEGATRTEVACWNGDVVRTWGEPEGVDTVDCVAIHRHRSGDLYLGDWDGLLRTDGRRFERLGPEQGFDGVRVYSLAEDHRGTLYIGHGDADRMRLTTYDGSTFNRLLDLPRIHNCCISSILPRSDGEVWFGIGGLGEQLSSRGLGRYRGAEDIDYCSVDQGLPDSRVEALCEDDDGHVWVGTVGGLCRYDGAGFHSFTTADGLPNNHVQCLHVDCQGRLWIGTQAGVTRYDGELFQTVHSQDIGATFAITEGVDGRLWFAGLDGLAGYQPQAVPPRIRILRVGADRVHESTTGQEVSTSARHVSFEFRGLSSRTRPGDMLYTWRLQGWDDDWQPPARSLRADYQDLPPGDYSFQVRAIDRDLNRSDPARVPLHVVAEPRAQGLAEALSETAGAQDFVGTSPSLRRAQSQLAQIAVTRETVLILGETGTGKGVAARAVHSQSPVRGGPFIQVNCGAIPRDLVESELFGHERGAFTGAVARRLGKVELAQGGTLFLDEIGDMPLEAQVKLLQVLEERTFVRVGGQRVLPAEVRVIAATNRDLAQMVAAGEFREDLYYRLRVFEVELPPLRARREDIPLLAIYFAERMSAHLHRPLRAISPAAERALLAYDWPGNVRELEHAVKRAVIVSADGEIRAEDLALDPRAAAAVEAWPTLQEYERRYIRKVLDHTEGRIRGDGGAASLLGMNPSTLYSRMKKLGLPPK